MICTGQGVAQSLPIIYLYLGRPTVIIPTMVPDRVPIVAVALSLLIWSSRPTLVVPSRRFHRQRRRQWFPCQELGGVAVRFLLILQQNMETILNLASYWQHDERPAHVAEREENLARSLSRMARVGLAARWPDARRHQPEQGENKKKTGPEKKMSISENLTQDVWLNYHS